MNQQAFGSFVCGSLLPRHGRVGHFGGRRDKQENKRERLTTRFSYIFISSGQIGS